MQPTCQLIRRPITRRNPWQKWIITTAEVIGGVVTIALLVTLTILALAL